MVAKWYLIALLLFAPATAIEAVAQQPTEAETQGTEVEDATDAAENSSDETPVETDDESYLDIDEEDFRPSEEIPADQSITYPTDI